MQENQKQLYELLVTSLKAGIWQILRLLNRGLGLKIFKNFRLISNMHHRMHIPPHHKRLKSLFQPMKKSEVPVRLVHFLTVPIHDQIVSGYLLKGFERCATDGK